MARTNLILLAAILLSCCQGCVNAIGGFTYQFKGRIVDKKSGDPVSSALVYGAFHEDDVGDPDWLARVAVPVGPDGEFEFSRSIGTWCQTYLFGFIPLRDFGQIPFPPSPDKVVILLKLKGRWYAVPAVPVRQEGTKPAEGMVDVGVVAVRVDQLVPTKYVPRPWSQSRPAQ